MTLPLVVLAAGALLVGFLGMPAWLHLPDLWSHWLEGVVASLPGAHEHHHDAGSGWTALIAGSVAGLGGIGFAWVKYANKPWHAAEQLSPLHQFLMDKWRVDEFYQAVIVGPMTSMAQLLGNIDRIAVDGLTKLASALVQAGGWILTRLQNGHVHVYGTMMTVGLVGTTWWVLYPHPHIDAAAKGDAVHFVAGAGLGYEYRWDFDSDGNFDTEWGATQRDASYAYDLAQIRGVELVLTEAAGRHRGRYTVRLEEGEQRTLDGSRLGDGWRTNPDSRTPPSVRFADGKVYVRPGASELRVNGVATSGDVTEVEPGSVIQFGLYTKMRVDAVVRSTLAVRSVFGNVAKTSTDVVIQFSGGQRRADAASSSPRETFAQRGEVH